MKRLLLTLYTIVLFFSLQSSAAVANDSKKEIKIVLKSHLKIENNDQDFGGCGGG